MEWILVIIGNHRAFSNEKNPYRIVGFKRPLHENIKQFNREFTNGLIYNKAIYENPK